MKIFCAGLTGGIGAGKSAAAEMLTARGAWVVDADIAGRDLTAPGGAGVAAARKALGAWAVAPDGGLDRKAVRARVFADPALRRALEAALHPLIREETTRRLRAGAEREGFSYAVLSAPLLLESGALADLCDRILVVDCDLELQIERAARRDGADAEEIRRIAAAQMTRAQRLARADDVLDNNGGWEELDAQAAETHRKYEGLAREKAEGSSPRAVK